MVKCEKKKCPNCGKPQQLEFQPFCSERCANVDLGNWFLEKYVVSRPITDEDDALLEKYFEENIKDDNKE